MMDLQVAVFLIIFLSLSSLATIGICFVEIRSCWRQYRFKVETQRLRKLNLTVEQFESINNEHKDVVILESALEPVMMMEPMPYLYQSQERATANNSLAATLNHLDLECEQQRRPPNHLNNGHLTSPPMSEPSSYHMHHNNRHFNQEPLFHRSNLEQDEFEDANNHHFIYASHHRSNHMGIGAYV